MTITELIQSTIDSSKERLKTPIVGSFICSFIIFNWRPIVILIFSDEKIENRLKGVDFYFNTWYWTVLAITVPILMVGVYTFLIPMLMVWVDEKLEPTKEKRIKRVYKSKQFVIKEKITLAIVELDLKNAESGNREKQDFIDRIKFLEDSKEQLEESKRQMEIANKNSIDQLNAKLKEANINNENLVSNIQEYKYIDPEKIRESLGIGKEFHKYSNETILKAMSEGIFANWQLDQLFSISDLNKTENNIIDSTWIDDAFLKDLIELQILSKNDKGIYQISDHGEDFIEYVKKKNSKYYQNFRFKHNL
ncbi:hypothetical protein [Flavobacterium sp. LC2016-12]|uniref:hypothetical protein n=1 Tax=Flavobacterium sp. LC2016-12 TaxID=2783794 RepID=UPI00188D29A6|nr:hypothetical protein [Flavobacterium sp. LC2016-12]MBF4466403.1 hypothetical protein [Flavobacterium sp. LC2016-12]